MGLLLGPTTPRSVNMSLRALLLLGAFTCLSHAVSQAEMNSLVLKAKNYVYDKFGAELNGKCAVQDECYGNTSEMVYGMLQVTGNRKNAEIVKLALTGAFKA